MSDYLNYAKEVIQIEIDAISDLVNNLDTNFSDACETLIKTTGRIIVIGMGKSGHIGHKIAATLASTGSPAFFVHPGEASHGDFGMITAKDSILALSYSGNTQEIVSLLPLIKRLEVPLISITGNPNSELAKYSDIHLNVQVKKEACPLNLAPTASTTSMLVMGDALAISLLSERGFTAEQFAFSHPGGSLGKRLLLSVDQLMSKDALIPLNNLDDNLEDAIINMNQKALGMTVIIADKKENNNSSILAGILTDGDLRRAFSQNLDLKKAKIKDIMTKNPITISQNTLASDALIIMKDKKITSIVITDSNTNSNNEIVGVIHLHHLLKAGLS
jgi:arabinose-5-phosphate isomerase